MKMIIVGVSILVAMAITPEAEAGYSHLTGQHRVGDGWTCSYSGGETRRSTDTNCPGSISNGSPF